MSSETLDLDTGSTDLEIMSAEVTGLNQAQDWEDDHGKEGSDPDGNDPCYPVDGHQQYTVTTLCYLN